jgi:hypothetical protein
VLPGIADIKQLLPNTEPAVKLLLLLLQPASAAAAGCLAHIFSRFSEPLMLEGSSIVFTCSRTVE